MCVCVCVFTGISFKFSLPQVEVYAETKGLSIVGYYHANELVHDRK